MRTTSKTRCNMIVRRYKTGRTRRNIARELGMKPETVKKILEQGGFAFVPQRRNKLTLDREAQLVERYEQVKSGNVVGREFGCSAATVRNIVRRAGRPTQRRGNVYREFSKEHVDAMVAMYANGASQEKVAAHYRTSQVVVSRMLRERGAEIRNNRWRGERHWAWRGGRYRFGNYEGVAVLPDAPFAAMRNSTGYVLEHRLVMARHLGRVLEQNETVHHIDGNGLNNAIENLELRRGKHGRGGALQCADCGSRNVVSVALAEKAK